MAELRCHDCGAPVTGYVCEYCGGPTANAYSEILRNYPPVFYIKDGELTKDEMKELSQRMKQGEMIRI